MMDCPNFNVEDYRQPHESDNEWRLKKTFLELHQDKFPIQRLLCLASCFLNIECYGNRYPGPVMEQIKQLSEDMGDELQKHRAAKTNVTQVKFVKASDQHSAGTSKTGSSNLAGLQKTMMFVKASDNYKSTERDETETQIQDPKHIFIQDSEGQIPQSHVDRKFGLGSQLKSINKPKNIKNSEKKPFQTNNEDQKLRKFYQLANHVSQIRQKFEGNSVSVLNMAVQKIQQNMSVDFKSEQGLFVCKLIYNDAILSVGHGTNKKSAKLDTCDKCIEKLEMPYLGLTKDSSGNLELESSVEPFNPNLKRSDKSQILQDNASPMKKARGSAPLISGNSGTISQSVSGSFESGAVFSQGCDSAEDEARLEQFQQLGTAFRKLKESGQNTSQVIHMAIQKCHSQMKILVDFTHNGSEFVCEIKIDSVLVSQGTGANKKAAKEHAFEILSHVFTNPFLRIVGTESNLCILESSHIPFVSVQQVQRTRQKQVPGNSKVAPKTQMLEKSLTSVKKRKCQTRPHGSNFILMQPNRPADELNALTVLHNSAAMNRVPIEYEYFNLNEGVQCNLYIGNDLITDVTAQTKQEARQYAADLALVKLQDVCWTIISKQQADTDESSISKDEIKGDSDKINQPIPESNVGSKLLKKMGWEGGGVGKTGQGIAEPVNVSSVINRSGLGLQAEQGIDKDFLPRIKTIIVDYVKSVNFGDLAFTNEFSKEERALIHKESQKLGLKSHSHGKGEERYLIVSRKMSAKQILQYVQENGGDTPKYSLLPPASC